MCPQQNERQQNRLPFRDIVAGSDNLSENKTRTSCGAVHCTAIGHPTGVQHISGGKVIEPVEFLFSFFERFSSPFKAFYMRGLKANQSKKKNTTNSNQTCTNGSNHYLQHLGGAGKWMRLENEICRKHPKIMMKTCLRLFPTGPGLGRTEGVVGSGAHPVRLIKTLKASGCDSGGAIIVSNTQHTHKHTCARFRMQERELLATPKL